MTSSLRLQLTLLLLFCLNPHLLSAFIYVPDTSSWSQPKLMDDLYNQLEGKRERDEIRTQAMELAGAPESGPGGGDASKTRSFAPWLGKRSSILKQERRLPINLRTILKRDRTYDYLLHNKL